MKGKHLFALGAAAFALAAAAFLTWPPAADQPAVVATAAPQPAAPTPFVPSLAGTEVDGASLGGADAASVASEDLVELFDYYLSAVGERPLDQVRAEIERELDRRLRPPAANAAKRLLARYLDYRGALVALEGDQTLAGADAAALRKRLLAMRRLRARYFNEGESRAMFGREDTEQQDALARLAVRQDPRLTQQQKDERLAMLDAALPPEVREAREAPLKLAHLQESVEQLRARGGVEDEVFRLRAAALDPAAAARLADLDREEANWRGRIAAYLGERRNLRDGPSLAALRNRLFTPEEQRRLPAYEGGAQ